MAYNLYQTRPHMLSDIVDRLFDQAFAPFWSTGRAAQDGGTTGYQSLPVNIWETTEGYHAALLAPGLDEQSIRVTAQEDSLVVEGELRFQVPDGAQSVWEEFTPVTFRRSIRLGSAVDPTRVEAEYRNGLLHVSMPKSEHAKPRQVQVQMAQPAQAQAALPKSAKK